MTTTLRPAGPERAGAGGERARDYSVCVNSRVVGSVTLGATPTPGSAETGAGSAVGRIDALAIAEDDRRRGRGTVAALAAEEVLRHWGCSRVETSVPAEAEHGLRIATALGYTERNRTMLKQLGGERRPLPPGSALRPLDGAEYGFLLTRDREHYITALTYTGVPRAEAEAREAAALSGALPGGPDAAGSALYALDQDGGAVGRLWLRPAPTPGWVHFVEVDEAHRGNGHGRTLMLAAEDICRDAGAGALALNVFSLNTTAVRLYTSLGYLTTDRHLYKSLI